jgi:hypothetical protein
MENALENSVSVIDKAIAAAKARATAKGTNKIIDPQASKEDRLAALKIAKESRAADRQAKKAAKSAVRAAPVHMTKVEKAASKLPNLSNKAAEIFHSVTTSFDAAQLTALALHLQHHNRVQATIKASTAQPLKVGQVVLITGGDPKYIGMRGALDRVQRIRCYVNIPGIKRPIYQFTSDVEVVNESGTAAPSPDPVEEAPVAAVG